MRKKRSSFRESSFRMIFDFLKGQYRFFLITIFFSVFTTVLNSLTPQIISIMLDAVLVRNEEYALPGILTPYMSPAALQANPRRSLLLLSSAIALIAVLSGVCNGIVRTAAARGSEGFVQALRNRLYEHIQKLPFNWHVRHQTGEIIQRCTSDVEVVRNFVTNQMLEVLRVLFLIVYSLIIMFSMNWQIALIAAGFIPVIVLYSGIFYSKIAARFREADEAEGALSTNVQENLTGVRVVRAFGRERYEIERFNVKNERFSSLWIQLGKLMSLYWSLGDMISGLQILTVIVVGVVFAVKGTITLGAFTAFVSYNATLIWPVRGLGRILSEMSKASVSIDRVAYILNAEEEPVPEKAALPAMDQDICFEHVTFAYEGMQPVLKDLDFTIRKGSVFAILGGTGSGKSTMTYLLDRLYDLGPAEGRITIGGVDIREIRQTDLRRQIGLVLQEPFLFSRTVRENISIARKDAPMEDVRMAASIACVDEAIDTFSQGYDTIVGERGVTLSGGQKQRVAIARMLMQKAPIMIFDDSLSAVDAETDAKIRHALRKSRSGATVILISHRITTLMQADQILVLNNGAVEAIGTHEELIKRPGMYQDIYNIQMSSRDRELLKEADAGADSR